jgi:hypothetical protein
LTWEGTAIKSYLDDLAPMAGTLPVDAGTFDFQRLAVGQGSWFAQQGCLIRKLRWRPYAVGPGEVKGLFR